VPGSSDRLRKELFAQSIHQASPRSAKAFIPINCAAIPDNLLETTLFGTSKGAFTGAIDKAGLLEEAQGGTILLDELNSMSLELQAKLLRVIQEKK
jgi:arginine utilization regulatory protein